MPQFTTAVHVSGFGELVVHFVHARSSKSTVGVPLLFLHGWPGSFVEVGKALALLNGQGFHVVAPSLPGFAFSSYPDKAGFKLAHHAQAMHGLMVKLGYERYVVQGGDWGGDIAPNIARQFPDSVMAMHVNFFNMTEPTFTQEPQYTAFEEQMIARYNHFMKNEMTYCSIQETKPLTLGIGLHDSPIALLSWFLDKILLWSDSSPRVPGGYKWSHTELITWTLLHYFALCGPTTGLAPYAENGESSFWEEIDYLDVPTGISAFKGERWMVPRCWAETKARVVFYAEHSLGGHFAMYEKPDDMVDDIVRFCKQLSIL
ncbi:glycosylphosphatidylinositol anchor biosynthesis [Elasticomyces elasticus]|nr:glycosylphosphatidylinositol anchor biosynthesis [Elasticomyces elasticus]KAK4994504.1 glycosylphosphatidylinositol anchor biosynthesis [Elasticomyces elasticus]